MTSSPVFKSLSTRISEQDVRDFLKGLSLFQLSGVLLKNAWKLELLVNGPASKVSASKEHFNGSYSPVCFGYYIPNPNEKTILAAGARLAELCLQIDETFTGTFPRKIVDATGSIVEDPELKEAHELGPKAVFDYHGNILEKSSSFHEDGISHVRGFYHLSLGAQATLLNREEVEILKGLISK